MSVEEFLFIRDLQTGIVPPLKDSEFTYNTLIHRDFEAVLAFQDRFSSEEPTLADYRYLLKQEKIWQQRYAQDHNRQTQFEFITIRIFRLTMIDRVKPPEQPSPFTNVEDAMAQLQALAKPVVSYLYTVEVWNYFELYWFRHLMVALPSKTIKVTQIADKMCLSSKTVNKPPVHILQVVHRFSFRHSSSHPLRRDITFCF